MDISDIIDPRQKKYGRVVYSSTGSDCKTQWIISNLYDKLVDESDEQFTGGFSKEVYYQKTTGYYRIFDFEGTEIVLYEVREKG